MCFSIICRRLLNAVIELGVFPATYNRSSHSITVGFAGFFSEEAAAEREVVREVSELRLVRACRFPVEVFELFFILLSSRSCGGSQSFCATAMARRVSACECHRR